MLEADFLVSMPKIKTHHWSGVTLSMKNMFGVVPGARYGWPKNILHWKGIQESILDLCATVPVHFVIADGIVAMEGNGPLNGTPRPLGKIVLADDPVAADATCARLMGFEPDRIAHIREGSRFLGNASPASSIRLEKPSMHRRLLSRWFLSFDIFMRCDPRRSKESRVGGAQYAIRVQARHSGPLVRTRGSEVQILSPRPKIISEYAASSDLHLEAFFILCCFATGLLRLAPKLPL